MRGIIGVTDEKLAENSLKDSSYFEALVRRYEDKLARYVRRKSNANNQDIQDILQNVFIKTYTNLNGFNPSLKFSSWIYRITHNEIISWHRRHKVRPQGNSIDLDHEVLVNISSDVSLEDDFHLEENKILLRLAITNLDEKYKDIILLRFFEEKDYNEISDILQMPPGTVATRLNRAKKQLAKLLKDPS